MTPVRFVDNTQPAKVISDHDVVLVGTLASAESFRNYTFAEEWSMAAPPSHGMKTHLTFNIDSARKGSFKGRTFEIGDAQDPANNGGRSVAWTFHQSVGGLFYVAFDRGFCGWESNFVLVSVDGKYPLPWPRYRPRFFAPEAKPATPSAPPPAMEG